MAAVAFANSVRHACPACACASGRRGRSQPDDRGHLPCLPSDRRSPARQFRPLHFGRRGERVLCAWGISRPGESRPANPCRFCIRKKGKCVFRTRAAAGSIMEPAWRRIEAPRVRRRSFPRSPRVIHRERPPEFFAHVEFPARQIQSPPLPCCASRNFREKRILPLDGRVWIHHGAIMGERPAAPHARIEICFPIPPLRFRGFGRPSFPRTWNFPTGSPPIAKPLQISMPEREKTRFAP